MIHTNSLLAFLHIIPDDKLMPNELVYTTTKSYALPLLNKEDVVFASRKNFIFLIVPFLIATLAIGILGFILITQLPDRFLTWARLVCTVLVLFVDIIIVLDWATTVYLVTNKRIQYRFGIIGERVLTIPVKEITDTSLEIGLLGRIFNYGTVRIESANLNSTILFRNIPSAEEKKNEIDDIR